MVIQHWTIDGHALETFFWSTAEAQAWTLTAQLVPEPVREDETRLCSSGWFWRFSGEKFGPCHGPYASEAEALEHALEHSELWIQEAEHVKA